MSWRSAKTSPSPDEIIHQSSLSTGIGSMCSSSSYSPINKRVSSVGSVWTLEISNLKECGSVFEVVTCLRRIEEVLNDIDPFDILRYCKADFEGALRVLRNNGLPITEKLSKSFIAMMVKYFDECRLWVLPEIILQEIFLMLPVDEIGVIPSVCSYWKTLYTSDVVWKTQYASKFLLSNPTSAPSEAVSRFGYWSLFRDRLADPHTGDVVEVAWRGKFRLEGQDVYQGLAWWVATVVDHRPPSRYKIHYPGWEERWDEWVDRRRLRWGSQKDLTTRLGVNDPIELWCCGLSVPGAWLESTVKKVRRGQYCVLRAQSSGSVWVTRDRIRPRRRKRTGSSNDSVTDIVPQTISGQMCFPGGRCSVM
mmetsp:Transcript_1920/g.3045  ORF Transcript_1920/g.3045 Transcript_1920/m.3045 type:complete len:364 (-) Transcript_1920:253-1344(-)|eukprot:CAMPEP_0185021548 /NCGR_PEP_ID=MMETSP1103-20130426/4241_1 /TAXON_ID=36769 /ORGANISM="Paraphysomonas bandaiensis, Strain Caron Lab Isolate" /LENGTH=363 /DNA_ID=CAMNT_0027553135 /DNA_START=156 /DNA_END=1247 /DNA_ORIENTATION=-